MPRKRRKKTGNGQGATRREFLTGVTTALTGAAVAGGGLLGMARAEEASGAVLGPGKVKITLEVNGRRHDLSVEPRATLLEVLREDLRLTGTKSACEMGQCGACTVHLDGLPHYSCLTLAMEAVGRKITTIEGLSAPGGDPHPVQAAFVEKDALQCGFCTPGQVLTAAALLARNGDPTPKEIREGMAGNICRCGTYPRIFEAVAEAAARTKKRR
jgi:xanthine dehydrogenase YagT iron-sulfur-binding subunit